MRTDTPSSSRAPRSGAFRTVCRAAGFALLLASLFPQNAAANEREGEYRIKGAYLYNFTKFVQWPPEAFSSERAPLTIGVLGEDGIAAQTIAATFQARATATGRAVTVRRFSTVSPALAECQIIFVTRSAGVGPAEVRAALGDQAVLLVGESEGFAQRGGTINFVVSGDTVRFEVNLRRAERNGLKLSGSLASMARLVRDREID